MRIIWSDRARREVDAIADDYRLIDADLADRLLDRIAAAPDPLRAFPDMGAPASGGSRKWRVPGTPFLLFYDVTSTGIEIATVQHDRSNWRRP